MGFMPVSIFYFVLFLTMPDGNEAYYAPAFPSAEACEQFVHEVMAPWVDGVGAHVEHFQDCSEVEFYIRDDSV